MFRILSFIPLIVLLGACSNKEVELVLPTPTCVLQREFHYRLPVPTPDGDTASVIRTRYSSPELVATAYLSSSNLTIQLTGSTPEQAVSLLIPTSILSANWVGNYPCQPFAINRPTASVDFQMGSATLYPTLSTAFSLRSSGEIHILAYDSRTHLLRGTYTAQQQDVPDPNFSASPNAVQKKCTVVVDGSFENLLVQ